MPFEHGESNCVHKMNNPCRPERIIVRIQIGNPCTNALESRTWVNRDHGVFNLSRLPQRDPLPLWKVDRDYPCLMIERIVTRIHHRARHLCLPSMDTINGADLNEIADMCA